MKKILLTAFAGLTLTFGYALNATDFTANDCSSVSHNLFTELAAGKVVVITWVMPCSACITSASTAANTVIAMGNPNVVFYLVDDYANTNCATLNSWASTNSIVANATFSNSTIDMTDYGTTGMPKTIVIGTSGFVTYNVNGTVSQTALQNAINNGLTGVKENSNMNIGLDLFPNPAQSKTTVSFELSKSIDIEISAYNVVGEKTLLVANKNFGAGVHSVEINVADLAKGVYMIEIKSDEGVSTKKLVIE